MKKKKGHKQFLDIMNVFQFLQAATDLERARTPKGVFCKRVVNSAAEAVNIGDVVPVNSNDGIVRDSYWGVSVLTPDYRGFYPVCWTGDCGDKINCWYRIV
jgi:hypothetical protein